MCFRFGEDGVWDECLTFTLYVIVFKFSKIFAKNGEVKQGTKIGYMGA
jgi:hypothetical protein